MLASAPAAASGVIRQGDELLEIDNIAVTHQNFRKLSLGVDLPGSTLKMKLARGRNVMNVTLVRACATEFRDRRQMFQLFTQIKDSAMQTEDKKIGKVLGIPRALV